MKKIFISLILIMSFITTSCSQTKDFKIESIEFTDEQAQLLAITGNRVLKYDLKNLPNDKNYEIRVIYEVYENKEKTKENLITGMAFEPTNEKIEDMELLLNIQDNKIICMSGGGYTSIDIEEDITQFSYQVFSETEKINLGDEVYLFKGGKSETGFSTVISNKLSKEDKDKFINENEISIFIKLVCE